MFRLGRVDDDAPRFSPEHAPPPDASSAWDAYWARLPCRHAVFGAEAAHYVDALAHAIELTPATRVLDFGCGVGIVAATLAPRVGSVTLYDESPAMRRRARAHVTGIANAVVADPVSLTPPIPDGFDLVLANSVVQYMPFDALCDWLPRWRSLLARGGRVVLSDVLPTRRRRGEVARELFETLALQARHGLLLYAIRTRLGDVLRYTQARRAAPLTRVEPEKLAWLARGRGFEVDVLPRNLTCRRGRTTMVLSAR